MKRLLKTTDQSIKNNKGVTIIEVLVAVVLLALFVGPILSTMVATTRIQGKAKQQQEYTNICQDVMEAIKAESLDSVYNHFSNWTPEQTDWTYAGISSDNVYGSCTALSEDDEVMKQLNGSYTFTMADIKGTDKAIQIDATLDSTYSNGGQGFSEFNTGKVCTAQMFKYTIVITLMEEDGTQIAQYEGSKLENKMITYPEVATPTPTSTP